MWQFSNHGRLKSLVSDSNLTKFRGKYSSKGHNPTTSMVSEQVCRCKSDPKFKGKYSSKGNNPTTSTVSEQVCRRKSDQHLEGSCCLSATLSNCMCCVNRMREREREVIVEASRHQAYCDGWYNSLALVGNTVTMPSFTAICPLCHVNSWLPGNSHHEPPLV